MPELDVQYADMVEMVLLVPEELQDAVEREAAEKTAGKAVITRLDKVHYGIAGGKAILL